MMDRAVIKNIRKWMGHTQPEFAKGLGVSIATIWRWEHGHTKPGGTATKLLEKMRDEMEATDA